MLKKIVILFICFLVTPYLFSQIPTKTFMSEGMQFFKKEMYKQAVTSFLYIIKEPNLKSQHGDAYFWISKSYFILNEIEKLEKSLEYYISNYSSNSHFSDAFYLKGRLLFKQKDYEHAIQVFQSFIDTYPESSLIPNAYFWVGESLFLLGNFDLSLNIFKTLIQKYPKSVKVEASKYRISLVNIKKRENELLKLLKISHEESLKTLEEFQKKIRTYEQAISTYQKKLASKEKSDPDISNIEEQIRKKDMEIAELKKQIDDLIKKLSEQDNTSAIEKPESIKHYSSKSQETDIRTKLTQVKNDALNLKMYLLSLLKAQSPEGL